MTSDVSREPAEKTSSASEESGNDLGRAGSSRLRALVRVAALRWGLWVAAVVASVALLLGLFFFIYRPDAQADPAEADSAVAAAREGTAAVYSYASDTIDRDIASAKSHLSGDFLTQYEKDATTGAVAIAKQKTIKTSGTVVDAAMSQMRPGSADVLVLLNLTSTTPDSPGPQVNNGSLMVTMTKVDGKWLISSMKPI